MSLLVVRLIERRTPAQECPDFTYHYARPGHVNALCGAERLTNGDVCGLLATCPECVRIASTNGDAPEVDPEGGNHV